MEYNDYNNEEIEQIPQYEEKEASSSSPQWTPEQIQEMEGYYKRYLEVFHKTHGYDYEPESMEVVYTEYLKFREHKAKEYYEKEALEDYKQKEAAEEEQQARELAQEEKDSEQEEAQAEIVQLFQNETTTKTERNIVADQIMVKPVPFELEISLKEQQQEQEEGQLYKNATEPMATRIVATPTTIAIR